MSLQPIERVVVIRNPVSTNANRGAGYIAELKERFTTDKVVIIETAPGGIAANEALLQQHSKLLGPETLLAVAAGDGTLNMVVTILLHSKGFSELARQTIVMPLWCGNANDLAHMLTGRAPRTLKTVLEQGKPLGVRPLECHLTTADGAVQTHLAVSYASFGGSAAAARRLGNVIRSNHPSHHIPGVRFIRELGSVHRSLRRAPKFGVTEEGSSKLVFECMFLNGSRFAKVGGIPLSLTAEKFHGTMASDNRLSAVLLHVVQLRSRRQAYRFARTRVVFTVADDIWGQFDGETVPITAGTEVMITLSDQSLRFLGTRRFPAS